MGASFDTIDDQKGFVDGESFPFDLIVDTDHSVGKTYMAERTPDMPMHDKGLPRRITYLISPDGVIVQAYDQEAEGADISTHAEEVLNDIRNAG